MFSGDNLEKNLHNGGCPFVDAPYAVTSHRACAMCFLLSQPGAMFGASLRTSIFQPQSPARQPSGTA